MNTKATSLILTGATLVATVVPAFASNAKVTTGIKGAKVCSMKTKNLSAKKAAIKTPTAALKNGK